MVNKSNRISTLSVFSNSIHVACKCSLYYKNVKILLIKFYNIILEKVMYLEKWAKILDMIIEKGKGPILGKLKIMQLIEAEIQLIMRICVDARIEKNE